MTNAYLEEMSPVLEEFVQGLSHEAFSFLKSRCRQDLCGDKADVANMLAGNPTIDAWLSSATTGDEWFEMLRNVSRFVRAEAIRRDSNKPEKRNGRRRRA